MLVLTIYRNVTLACKPASCPAICNKNMQEWFILHGLPLFPFFLPLSLFSLVSFSLSFACSRSPSLIHNHTDADTLTHTHLPTPALTPRLIYRNLSHKPFHSDGPPYCCNHLFQCNCSFSHDGFSTDYTSVLTVTIITNNNKASQCY